MGFDIESLLMAKAGGSGGASSWNDLADRPFYTEGSGECGPLDIQWDGVIGNNLYIEDMQLYKVSDLVLTAEQLIGSTVVLFDESSGKEETAIITSDIIEDMSSYGIPAIFVAEGFIGCVSEAFEADGISAEAGVYFVRFQEEGAAAATYVKSLSNSNVIVGDPEVVHKLDNKYLDLAWMPTSHKDFALAFNLEEVTSFNNYFPEYVNEQLFNSEQIIVSFNGEEYQRDAFVVRQVLSESPLIYYDVKMFGNPTLESIVSYDGEDNGDPFCVTVAGYVTEDGTTANLVSYFRRASGVTTDSLLVYTETMVYNKLPEEYLPESVSGKTFKLSGTSYGDDISILQEICETCETKGAAVCIYDGTIYSVLSVGFDTADPYATLLLARALSVGTKHFELYVLRYGGPTSATAPVLYPILNSVELYLNSSTSLSTKRFKITVDDSGTLTATEVTA